jgi:hypothetical protein
VDLIGKMQSEVLFLVQIEIVYGFKGLEFSRQLIVVSSLALKSNLSMLFYRVQHTS